MTQVTLKDVYEAINRVEDKIDQRMSKIEGRVDVLEDFRGKALGIMSIVTVIGTAGFTWIWNRITKG